MIALIGGSGIYNSSLFSDVKQVKVHTPYGNPSDLIHVGKFQGKELAFLSRHGVSHSINPSNVNYRANIWALKELGVTHIFSAAAVGSLQENIHPGEIVILDQFIDRTHGRKQTFFDGQQVCHVSMADPFCPVLRKTLIDHANKLNLKFHTAGTYVCIEGPRFSTKAESQMYQKLGASVIGMTLVPEAVLAKEAEICYASIAMATDYDSFKEHAVTAEDVIQTMKKNTETVKKLLEAVIPAIDEKNRPCNCGKALEGALM